MTPEQGRIGIHQLYRLLSKFHVLGIFDPHIVCPFCSISEVDVGHDIVLYTLHCT